MKARSQRAAARLDLHAPAAARARTCARLPMPNAAVRSLQASAGASSIAELRKVPPEKLLAATRGPVLAESSMDGSFRPTNTPSTKRCSSTTRRSWSATTQMRARPSLASARRRITSTVSAGATAASPTACSRPIQPATTTVPKTARDLSRDAAFGWHTWTWARMQTSLGKSKAYYYYFDQHPDYPADSPQAGHGSPHGMEVEYVFGHPTGGPSGKPSATDFAISDAMATYWTNFAKYGDPNGKGMPNWPAFNDAESGTDVLLPEPPIPGLFPTRKGSRCSMRTLPGAGRRREFAPRPLKMPNRPRRT